MYFLKLSSDCVILYSFISFSSVWIIIYRSNDFIILNLTNIPSKCFLGSKMKIERMNDDIKIKLYTVKLNVEKCVRISPTI